MKKFLVRIALVIVNSLQKWTKKEMLKYPDNAELAKINAGLRDAELGLSFMNLYLTVKK